MQVLTELKLSTGSPRMLKIHLRVATLTGTLSGASVLIIFIPLIRPSIAVIAIALN